MAPSIEVKRAGPVYGPALLLSTLPASTMMPSVPGARAVAVIPDAMPLTDVGPRVPELLAGAFDRAAENHRQARDPAEPGGGARQFGHHRRERHEGS